MKHFRAFQIFMSLEAGSCYWKHSSKNGQTVSVRLIMPAKTQTKEQVLELSVCQKYCLIFHLFPEVEMGQ